MIDFLHTAGGPPDPTQAAPLSHAILECTPGSPRAPMSVEAALRERMRLAALGADVGVALTRGATRHTTADTGHPLHRLQPYDDR